MVWFRDVARSIPGVVAIFCNKPTKTDQTGRGLTWSADDGVAVMPILDRRPFSAAGDRSVVEVVPVPVGTPSMLDRRRRPGVFPTDVAGVTRPPEDLLRRRAGVLVASPSDNL